jgi:hypothetical protein
VQHDARAAHRARERLGILQAGVDEAQRARARGPVELARQPVAPPHDGGRRQARLGEPRHRAPADEARGAEHHDLARPRRSGLRMGRRGRRGLRGARGERLAPLQHLGRALGVDRRRLAAVERTVEGRDRVAHADVEGVAPAGQAERERAVAPQPGQRVAPQRSAAPP